MDVGLRSSWKELPRPPRTWVEESESGSSAGPLEPEGDDYDDEDADSNPPPPAYSEISRSQEIALRRYSTAAELGSVPPVGADVDIGDAGPGVRHRASLAPGLGSSKHVASAIGHTGMTCPIDFEHDVDRLVQERLVRSYTDRGNMKKRMHKNTEYKRSCLGEAEDSARGMGWDLMKLLGCGPSGLRGSCLVDCSRSLGSMGCVETADACASACRSGRRLSRANSEQPVGYSSSRPVPAHGLADPDQQPSTRRSHTAMLDEDVWFQYPRGPRRNRTTIISEDVASLMQADYADEDPDRLPGPVRELSE